LERVRAYYYRRKNSPEYPKYLEVKRAQNAVRNAVKSGALIRAKKCSDCGKKSKIEAHHHNGYSVEHKLDVVWLCNDCHNNRHRKSSPF
jgi:hypothetical protein